jgi:hypothetical protein
MKMAIMNSTMADDLNALESELSSEDGFLFKLHFREFDPLASGRVERLVKRLALEAADHTTNYRVLWLLWQVQIELETARAYSVGGTKITQLTEILFPEFARIFDAELGALAKKSG